MQVCSIQIFLTGMEHSMTCKKYKGNIYDLPISKDCLSLPERKNTAPLLK